MLESTGTDLGMWWWEGVCVPGVEGGVNAGETRPGSWSFELDSEFEFPDSTFEREGCVRDMEFRSSSEMARETGMGRGE